LYHLPLHFAAQHFRASTVSLLLEAKADVHAVSSFGWTPLHLAGRASVVRALLCAKARLESADRILGLTPLMLAQKEGRESVVRALAEAKAAVRAR
jgi:ankyrin repeat protein